jgi:hypothetical protein
MFCAAFPDGIPPAVQWNEVRHDRLLTGQVGEFMFSPAVPGAEIPGPGPGGPV